MLNNEQILAVERSQYIRTYNDDALAVLEQVNSPAMAHNRKAGFAIPDPVAERKPVFVKPNLTPIPEGMDPRGYSRAARVNPAWAERTSHGRFAALRNKAKE